MSTFEEVVRDLRRGGASVELNEVLEAVAKAIDKTGNPGSITLTLSMKQDGSGRLAVTDKIVAKIPGESKRPSIFFVSEEGELSRSDPKQTAMRMEGLK